MQFGFLHKAVESRDLRSQQSTTKTRQAIIASPWIIAGRTWGALFHDALLEKFLQIVVQRSGTQLVAAVGLTGNLTHNPIAVPIFTCQGEQDMECGSGKRNESIKVLLHGRIPLYRIPTIGVRPYLSEPTFPVEKGGRCYAPED